MIENPASANLPYELTTMVVICTLRGMSLGMAVSMKPVTIDCPSLPDHL
jgi:hypothetical protein